MRLISMALATAAALHATTLSEIIDKARSNETVESFTHQLQSKELGLQAYKNGYWPKIEASGSYAKVNEKSPFDAGTSATATLRASMTVFDGFRREAGVSEREKLLSAAHSDLVQSRRQNELAAVQQFFNLLGTNEEIEVKKQKLQTLQKELSRALRFLDAGLAAKDRVEKLKASFEQTRYELDALQLSKQKTMLELSLISGLSPESITPQAAQITPPANQPSRTREDLRALQLQAQSFDDKARQLSGLYWPQIKLEDSFTRYRYGDDTGPFASMRLSQQNKIMLTASITLWDFFSTSRERQSLIQQKNALEQRLAMENKRSDYAKKLCDFELENALSKIQSAKARVESAKATFELVEQKYGAALADDIAYLDALTQAAEAKKELSWALYGYESAKARWYYEYGYDLKEFVR